MKLSTNYENNFVAGNMYLRKVSTHPTKYIRLDGLIE